MARDPLEFVGLALGGSAAETAAPAAPAKPLALEAQARLVHGYRWVERQLFEILGTWVESEASSEAQLLFDVYSQQHAWHAELFAERLPVPDVLDRDELAGGPGAGVERMFEALAGGSPDPPAADGPSPGPGRRRSGGTLLRLVGLSRVVLPRLVAGFVLHQRRARPVLDAPVVRAIRLTLRDEIDEWLVLEAFVQSLLRRPHDIAVVTSHQARLEEFVAEVGSGLVPWPEAQMHDGFRAVPTGRMAPGAGAEAERDATLLWQAGEPAGATTHPSQEVPEEQDQSAPDGPGSSDSLASAQVSDTGSPVPDDRRS